MAINIESSVNIDKINQSGADLIENAGKMFTSLQTIKGYIDASKSYFDSPAGDEMRRKFNLSAEKFGEFQSFLNSYGEFLKTFSGNVRSFEGAVQEVIGEIPVM
jgi:hypothetical protein